jgi:hypothetical protein
MTFFGYLQIGTDIVAMARRGAIVDSLSEMAMV